MRAILPWEEMRARCSGWAQRNAVDMASFAGTALVINRFLSMAWLIVSHWAGSSAPEATPAASW